MKNIVMLIVFILVSGMISAQLSASKGEISIGLVDQQRAPVESAIVELIRSKDSLLVKTELTDKAGKAIFVNIPFGSYFLSIIAVNYKKEILPVPELSPSAASISLSPVTLFVTSRQLENVTVSARKPFIQKLPDRTVVNVDNSIVSAGSSAMDVLERSPGVQVDQNDAISLRGKSGVIIMVDGKPTAMAGADLANYLRALPSSMIERMDIISNPSARYDAAGNSGIIDIRMKKDQRLGTNGTVTAGYGQGVYPKVNSGISFNHRNKKVNLFGNYNYAYRINLNHLVLDRNFYKNGAYNGGDLKDNYNKSPLSSHSARFGMDYFPDSKTIIGFIASSNFNHYTRSNNNHSVVIDPASNPQSTFQSLATNNDHSNNLVANINFKHRFDSAGKELTADADYGVYTSRSLSVNATTYHKLDGTVLQPEYILNGDQEGRLVFKTAKADYVSPIRGTGKFEAGVKVSFVSSDNDARFFDASSGSAVNDVNKTNHFVYKENNFAGYLNFSREYKKISIQVGIRGELTNYKTEQLKGNIKFDSGYFQLFPSAFFNYKPREDQILGLSVSRRIDRPGYSQLNPFLFLIDVTTYATGRPGLLPQLTWSYEVSYTIKNFNFTLGYSHAKNDQNIAIAKFKDIFPSIPADDNVTVQIPINLESSDYYGLTISAPVRINNWWNMISNANIYYNHFNGTLGNTILNNGKPSADLSTNNTLNFKKGWAAELNARANLGGQYGFMVVDPQWDLSAGIQKTVFKNKGTVRLNVTDIFRTGLPKAVITYDNYIEKWHAFRDSRVANLSFTYRFGNNKVQAARRRQTASEEEKQRAGN